MTELIYYVHAYAQCWKITCACAVVDKMAAASGSSAKLYRFPPTRELLTDNDAVVPPAQGRGRHARELEDYLRRRQEGAVDGKNFTCSLALQFMAFLW